MKLHLKRSVLMARRVKGWPLFRINLDLAGAKSLLNEPSVVLVTLLYNPLPDQASNIFVTGERSFGKLKD